MMDPFLVYPLPADAHPESVMWVKMGGGAWGRVVDGARVTRGQAGWILQLPGCEGVTKLHVRTIAGHDEEGNPRPPLYNDGAALAYVDREYPAPAPEIRAGQVWILPEGDGLVEIEVANVFRHPEHGPMVFLPTLTDDGEIRWINVSWRVPPDGAIMVRDVDGLKVWTPPIWARTTGAPLPVPEWRHVDDMECQPCGGETVEVKTSAAEGYWHDGDEVRCTRRTCAARGVVFQGGIVWGS